ncbi:hypothetical protein SAMN04488107_2016 [Geodermatophilus saharensis]|uniref:Uncharacterized protein n=1 Tax=Geodermatophilus saharensis TaxID=1137994 RepID=A0A239D612_9ACTN|nr:hypothetical protein [Geodermatophilus saharensis]SNS27790.1 hypothetical protein SAMN04488107_2016 [Geodermatophilus saharensis]
MPSVNSANLTLTTVGQNVTINITYNAVFTAFERQLAALGMTFHDHTEAIGVDPAGGTTGTTVATLPTTNFAVTAGAGSLSIPVNKSVSRTRASLQEDPAAGDADEIRCRIRIHSVGLPPEFTANVFSDQEVLLG